MPTTRPFAYNSGTTITGTDQVGDIAVGVSSSLNYSQNAGGVRWWNGPDEDLGYVIAHTTLSGTQPNPDNVPSYIGFWRSSSKTENSFISLTNGLFNQNFNSGDECQSYLTNNGYWSSWGGIVTNGLVVSLDSANISSYSGSGSVWYDLQSPSNNATLINTPTYSSTYGGVIGFDDASSEYATIPDIGDLNQWTVEVWFKLTSSITSKVSSLVTNQYNLSSKLNFSIGTNNAPSSYNLVVGFFNGAWRNTTGFAPSLNTWYQVVGTYDGSVIRQYVNGVASGGTLNYVGTPQSGGEIRLMRRWDDVVSSSNLIDGDLQVVRIYNSALTSNEVLQNYNAIKNRFNVIVSDNLFMELDASNYTSGNWVDETGNGNNASINGATWLSTDGGIFDFDGVNDTISVPHNSSLSLSTTTQKTVQVWVKFDALGGLNEQIPVFGKLSSNSGFDGYWGGLFSNGGVVRCVTNGTAIQKVSNSTLTVTTNTWYLLTFISQITSTSNTTKVYINETEYITNSHGSDTYSETNPFYLGYIGSGVSSLYLNGKIGACYFYTKGLSTTEISQNYNATKSKYGL